RQPSIWIWDAGVGLAVAAPWKTGGRSPNCAPPPRPRPPAGVNAPAATDCASVIVVSGSLSEARLSHGAADTGITLNSRTIRKADDKMTLVMIRHLVWVGFKFWAKL